MRLPNGYGSVSKLPGARRRPWRVRITVGWEITPDGKNRQKTRNLGFYATKSEALNALARYNADPSDFSDVTFAEVYQKATAKKFQEINRQAALRYEAAFRLCERIHDKRFADLRLGTYQQIADASGKTPSSLKGFKAMLSLVYDYAIRNDIVDSDFNISSKLDIGKYEQSDKHYRFTGADIEALWNASGSDDFAQVILMMIYSGVRPGELLNLKTENVDLGAGVFRVVKGKNANAVRVVPIHHRTLPFFERRMDSEYLINDENGRRFDPYSRHAVLVRDFWRPTLLRAGALYYTSKSGELREHLPDDVRHTFTTMWIEQRLNEAYRRKIQGHSGRGIGEQVYAHISDEQLCEELNKLV